MSSSLRDVPAQAVSVEPLPDPPQKAESSSYSQIFKSTALVGGSSALNVVIGVLRTKAMAMLLGPAGFGLFGLYTSVANLTQSIAGMGINSSGVRQIAEAAGSDDRGQIAQTAVVLRRTSVVLGGLGAIVLALFSRPISRLTFGTDQYYLDICLLSLAVFFNLVSAGQGALIQGMRRIADLAKMGVLGASFGLFISVPIVYFLRANGVVPSLIAVGAMTILTSWWYSRKIEVQAASPTAQQVWHQASILLQLGFAFMASSMMMLGSAYLVRITVLHKLGIEATGYYQSAWTLGVLYVGFILQAMGADFYPRLTAKAHDNVVCNRLVNEQARIGLLLAGPGALATLSIAPLVIALFYTAKFGPAVGILRWICLGAAIQVISWPMGFIIMAKGAKGILIWSELAWAAVHVGLAWICVQYFGLNGAGIAFFLSYIFHVVLIYVIVNRISGFTWSADNKKTGALFLALVAGVFCGFYFLPYLVAVSVGVVAAVLTCVFSIRTFFGLIPTHQIPAPLRGLSLRFRIEPSAP